MHLKFFRLFRAVFRSSFLLVCFAATAFATHHYGGDITWAPNPTPTDPYAVKFQLRLRYDADHGENTFKTPSGDPRTGFPEIGDRVLLSAGESVFFPNVLDFNPATRDYPTESTIFETSQDILLTGKLTIAAYDAGWELLIVRGTLSESEELIVPYSSNSSVEASFFGIARDGEQIRVEPTGDIDPPADIYLRTRVTPGGTNRPPAFGSILHSDNSVTDAVALVTRSTNASLRFQATDPDAGDTIRYRLATQIEATGSGGSDPSIPSHLYGPRRADGSLAISINPSNGMVTFDSAEYAQDTKLCSIQCIAEDFAGPFNSDLHFRGKSSVSSEVLVYVNEPTPYEPVITKVNSLQGNPINLASVTIFTNGGVQTVANVSAEDTDHGSHLDIKILSSGGLPSDAIRFQPGSASIDLKPEDPQGEPTGEFALQVQPTAAMIGSHAITFRVDDEDGNQSATYALTVKILDGDPVPESTITFSPAIPQLPIIMAPGESFSTLFGPNGLTVTATAASGHALNLTATMPADAIATPPLPLMGNQVESSIQWTASDFGEYDFVFTATDDLGRIVREVVPVHVQYDPPPTLVRTRGDAAGTENPSSLALFQAGNPVTFTYRATALTTTGFPRNTILTVEIDSEETNLFTLPVLVGATPQGKIIGIISQDQPYFEFTVAWSPTAIDEAQDAANKALVIRVTDANGYTTTHRLGIRHFTFSPEPELIIDPPALAQVEVGRLYSIQATARNPMATLETTLTAASAASGIVYVPDSSETTTTTRGAFARITANWTPGLGQRGTQQTLSFTASNGRAVTKSIIANVVVPFRFTTSSFNNEIVFPTNGDPAPATLWRYIEFTLQPQPVSDANGNVAQFITTTLNSTLPKGASLLDATSTPVTTVSNNGSLTVRWRPMAGQIGRHDFIFTCTDNFGGSQVKTWSIQVGPAGNPTWWSTYNVLAGAKADFAIANQGQVKSIATKAAQAFSNRFVNLDDVNEMIDSFNQTANYSPITQGQLKYVARVFYDCLTDNFFLHASVPGEKLYPWTEETADDRHNSPVTIGQVKALFSFELENP